MKDNRGVVGRFNGADHTEGAALRRPVCSIEHRVEGEFHVGGGDGAAVVKADAATEVNHVGERVRRFPAFRKVAAKIHLLVALEEATEEQTINALRLRVGCVTWVEVGGIGFDEEGERRGIVGGGV